MAKHPRILELDDEVRVIKERLAKTEKEALILKTIRARGVRCKIPIKKHFNDLNTTLVPLNRSICENLFFDGDERFTTEYWEKVKSWLDGWFKDEVGCRLERFGMNFVDEVTCPIQQAFGMEGDDEDDD